MTIHFLAKEMLERQFIVMGIEIHKEWYLTKKLKEYGLVSMVQKGGDEINIIKPGKNYGWPIITYGINYSGTIITNKTSMNGMEQPLYYWVPSIAPSGMAFSTSNVYPKWKNSLFVGSLKFEYLERLEIKKEKVIKREKVLESIGRVRNVKEGPDGYLYVAVEGNGILKIIPN